MVVILVLPHCTYQSLAEWLSFRTFWTEFGGEFFFYGKRWWMKRCFGIDRCIFVCTCVYIYMYVFEYIYIYLFIYA